MDKVTIVRGAEREGYPWLARPYQVDILTIAVAKQEEATANQRRQAQIEMNIKVRLIYQIANAGQ